MKKYFFYCLIGVILVSCSENQKPGREMIQTYIEKKSEGNVRLIDFKKINGLEREVFGAKTYTLEYKGKIEYLKDGFTVRFPIKNLFHVSDKPILGKEYYSKVKKNKTLEIKGKASFIKKEKGWEINKLKAY